MENHAEVIAAKFDKTKQTILVPDMFPIHMELLADVMRAFGYRIEVLKCSGQSVLDTGLKYIHNDMCYPAICSVGQQLYAVTSGNYDTGKIALPQFQTGGGCRASNYVMLLKKALQKLGLEKIPIVTLGFSTGLTGSEGFRITPSMCFRALAALTYGDMLMLLKNQVRPYEEQVGATQRLVESWFQRLHSELSGRGFGIAHLKKNLRQMARDFARIKTQPKKKIKVGIVGEVYVKYSPFGNNRLEEFLNTQDCEYMLPGVLGFIHYCLSNTAMDYKLYGGSRIKRDLGLVTERVIHKYETALRDVVREFPQFVAPASFRQMQKNGSKLLHCGVKMGEGWYLPAEIVELIENGYDNIICTQPFGCLPNHIVGKGVIRRFKELYPASNICPIDYDASASAVNQENRIKLMLSVARDHLKHAEPAIS